MVEVFYLNAHDSQYDPGLSLRTRRQGCVWTSAANGVDASSGGARNPSPDAILALLPQSQETNPLTPGWSLVDLDKAMARLGVGFEVRSGRGWDAVIHALDVENRYVILQGDSDVFDASTCSGNFDGDHCIGLHPRRNAYGQQRIDDPICPGARYAGRSILQRYAMKFSPTIRFGVFTAPVPLMRQPRVVLTYPTPTEKNTMLPYLNGTFPRGAELEKGQPLFRHPGGPRITRMSKRARVDRVAGAGNGWVCVRVGTGAPYKDKKVRPTGLYVPLSALGEVTLNTPDN